MLDHGKLGRTDRTLATRFSATATAAAIGLAAGALAALPSGVAGAAAHPAGYAPTALSALPFSVAGPGSIASGIPIGLPAFAAAEHEHVPLEHLAPAKPTKRPTSQPFHKTGRKARSLPDTGLPMSAALGAVTALTALLAGIGTVRAAGRRTDHES